MESDRSRRMPDEPIESDEPGEQRVTERVVEETGVGDPLADERPREPLEKPARPRTDREPDGP